MEFILLFVKNYLEVFVNKITKDVLLQLNKTPFSNQRTLANSVNCSLGAANKALKELIQKGYLDNKMGLTASANCLLTSNVPDNAIILAAGYGMRMVPINTETPKGLIEIYGEPLIERTIRQLHEAGIRNIYIVVGFMKEKYEYLIDEYGVTLLVNTEYSRKNNLHSLALAARYLTGSYIIPCDIWCRENPYSKYELYSWYMVQPSESGKKPLRINRNQELVLSGSGDYNMVGISYISSEDAPGLVQSLLKYDADTTYDNAFWEKALFQTEQLHIAPQLVTDQNVVEFNTYEQLREFDEESGQLRSSAMQIICEVLHAENSEIHHITSLKKGMTNRSFLFTCRNKRYIMRIPGEGSDRLINRKNEVSVYHEIAGRDICDNVLYINPSNGYKLTEYMENARVCDPGSEEDVKKCIDKLRYFHQMHLQVSHAFDIWEQIEWYESLRNGSPSMYKDYRETKAKILSLRSYIDQLDKTCCLTHIDAVPDNFLFCPGNDFHLEKLLMIDWEYAGMADPHIDIAMFAIYSFYNKEQIDHLIDLYFDYHCTEENRIKIYCYVAACGFLWSNWCEYKNLLGVDFGEYSLRQYRYAKDYYTIVQTELQKKGIL